MTAGLFICDRVNAEYQPEFGDYSDMFARLFPLFSWKYYDVTNGQFPTDLDECDFYMATGSRHSVYEEIDWIMQLKKLIREINNRKKYFIGFCFGHQLLGSAMGGKVAKSKNGWCVGVYEFEVRRSLAWMRPFQEKINLLMMCQDQIVELPENAVVLASANNCPNGIIQIGENMFGIQAHPEFLKEYDRLLMEKRVDRIGAEIVKEGIKSLEKNIHAELIRAWIISFLKK